MAGRSGSGLAVAGDIAGWRDPTTTSPGVFVGLANGLRVPAVQPAGSRCRYVQEDDRMIAGLPATVRRHQPCAGSAAELVEAVLGPRTAATSSSCRSRSRPTATGRTGC